MTQRDLVLYSVLAFFLVGSALIAYGFWRGRNAVPPGGKGDVWWSQLMRVVAVFLGSTLTIWIVVLVSPLPVWTFVPGTLVASGVAGLYAMAVGLPAARRTRNQSLRDRRGE